jgi:hypothetical protein
VQEYDKKFLYPMLIKCHERLHPIMKSFVNEDNFFIKIVVWIFFSRLQEQVN